jgi:endogenous inhibitor of DNA gyrase (YacG/DUF329 family)
MSKSRSHRAKCPICAKPSDVAYRPFCSRRCADVDLSRWLGGSYVIPGPADAREAENAGPADEAADEKDGERH